MQYDFGTIDPLVKDGTALAADLNSWRDAVHSQHGGAVRPPYVKRNMLWVDESAAPAYTLYVFDGTTDIAVFSFDATAHTGGVVVRSVDVNDASPGLRVTQRGSGPVFVAGDAADPDATPFIVDNSGNIGIGTLTPAAPLHVTGLNTGFAGRQRVESYANPVALEGYRANAAGAIVVDGDDLYDLVAFASDGTGPVEVGRIRFESKGAQAAGSLPTDLAIFVTATDALIEALRITGSTQRITVAKSAVNVAAAANTGAFALDTKNNFTCTPAGPVTLSFSNEAAGSGQVGTILLINTGGHAISVEATVKVDTDFLATVSAAGTYKLSYFCNGTNVYMTTSGALA